VSTKKKPTMTSTKKPTMAPRKAPDPVALDAFIHGTPAVLPQEKEKKPKKESRRRRAELGERVTAYLPPPMEEELRVRCAREKRSVSDAVTEAVGVWLHSPTGMKS
jgi:hypothetical protein